MQCGRRLHADQFPAAPVLFDKKTLAANARHPGRGHQRWQCQRLYRRARLEGRGCLSTPGDTALDLPANATLVLSTGVIGLPLPMTRIEAGFVRLPCWLGRTGQSSEGTGAGFAGHNDYRHQTENRQPAGRSGNAKGIAKGAAKIHPNMATLLAVVITGRGDPAGCSVSHCAGPQSTNAITVDRRPEHQRHATGPTGLVDGGLRAGAD